MKTKKRLFMVFICLLILLALLISSAFAFAGQPIKLFISGREIASDVTPQLVNDRVMVPLRVIAEALGAEVQWGFYGDVLHVGIKPNHYPGRIWDNESIGSALEQEAIYTVSHYFFMYQGLTHENWESVVASKTYQEIKKSVEEKNKERSENQDCSEQVFCNGLSFPEYGSYSMGQNKLLRFQILDCRIINAKTQNDENNLKQTAKAEVAVRTWSEDVFSIDVVTHNVSTKIYTIIWEPEDGTLSPKIESCRPLAEQEIKQSGYDFSKRIS
jgi:hypothetical protein